ncbi:RNA polymerase sigma factor [Oxalicibacterium flavum]|uniref:RNA polymerase sigma factor n=1 Tax=Oxalicibacterium flavum TaxID=179467 RepID=A0A8J2UNT8_9BURK|nr:sigma-70 family RNA polymerase sigma factor [Oxalicibacterium flavum]GGC15695.1 RNA polymerase sigma factor [Oxalicibacterium flavum]
MKPGVTLPAETSSFDSQALYQAHHHWLLGWLRRRLGNPFDAADLTHDTFLRILVSGQSPAPEQSRAHLTQIAKGLVVDLHRRRMLESAWLEALASMPVHCASSAEERAIVLESLLRIDAMLDALPAKVRETFLLSRFDGLTYSEIADHMGMSVATVRKYMLRAAQACLVCLPGGA